MTKKSTMDKYFSKHYDEKQLIDRYRISFETMILTFLLIMLSGMVKIFHGQWTTDNTEMIILLSLPATYFMIRSVMKGAYFSKKEKHTTFTLILFAFIGIVNVITIVTYVMRGLPLIENGVLTENLFQLFLALPFLSIPIAYLIKKMTDKNENDEEENNE
jgi:hypothetical protein